MDHCRTENPGLPGKKSEGTARKISRGSPNYATTPLKKFPADLKNMTKVLLGVSIYISMCFRIHGWNVSIADEALSPESFIYPVMICDAGSTGSRVYAFHVPKLNGVPMKQPTVELLGRSERGMSEFAELNLFHNASETIIPFLRRGLKRLGSNVPIYVFATGGVRSLNSEKQAKLWEVLRADIELTLSGVHNATLSLMALDGIDEALYGLLSANYLLNDYIYETHPVSESVGVGVLDLGGSSLELSLVGPDLQAGTDDDVLISFKSLGLQQFRKRVEELDSQGVCRFETVCSILSHVI